MDADWRHGMYQGPLKVEGLTVDLDRPGHCGPQAVGVVDTVARFEHDGNVGYGLWEYILAGPHDRYGFTSWTDGYAPQEA